MPCMLLVMMVLCSYRMSSAFPHHVGTVSTAELVTKVMAVLLTVFKQAAPAY